MLMTVMIILVSLNRIVALTVAAVEFIPSAATDCKIKAIFFFLQAKHEMAYFIKLYITLE